MRERFPIDAATAKEAGRFLTVGLVNTGLTMVVILALLRVDAPLLVANIVGYGAGFINSFIWNRRWTFRSTGRVRREIVVYSAVWLGSYLLQMGALLIASRLLGLSDEISTLVAMVFFTGPNYLGNRLFTFSRGRTEQ
jgi:putative flippase GtrA